jgi:hypothetical protein
VLEENTSRLGPEPPAKTVSIWIGSLDRGEHVCGSAPAFLARRVRADSGKLVAPLAVRIPLGSEGARSESVIAAISLLRWRHPTAVRRLSHGVALTGVA